MKINKKKKDEIFAALKLIENLFKNGKIKKHIYKNILNEYSDVIDISEFCAIIE